MLLSTYLSEVKVTREEDLAADADHLLAGIRETNFGDVVENLGSVYSDNKEALLDASSLVASHIFYDGNESPPRDEDEALLQTYQRFQERWNQLIQLFLELTIIMNGNVYLLMETLQTA